MQLLPLYMYVLINEAELQIQISEKNQELQGKLKLCIEFVKSSKGIIAIIVSYLHIALLLAYSLGG